MASRLATADTVDLVLVAGGIVAVLAVAVVLLGEAQLRLHRAANPLHRPVGVVRTTVLPATATLLFLRLVIGLPADSVWVQIAETAVWIFCVHAVLSFVTEVVFGRAREDTWQGRTPRLLVDLARGLLVAAAAAIVLSFVWGLDVKQGFAALGLGSIVIGLALQDPLGNLFSGLLVALERPFKVGDWLKIEDRVGRIVEINWRATHMQLGESETLIVPNPTLGKSTFVNLSRPTPDLRQSVDVSYPASVPPERVKRVLLDVLAETASVLPKPAPAVYTAQLGGTSTTYTVTYSVDDVGRGAAVRDAVMTRIWYASRREGLLEEATRKDAPADERGDPLRLLRDLPGIAEGRLAGADMARFGVRMQEYASGEAIVRQGERLRGFYLVVRGAVNLAGRTTAGAPRPLGRLLVGEFFGALQQASEVSELTATAEGDTAVLRFQDAALEALLEASPQIYRNVMEAARERRLRAARQDQPAG
jgi:small-conductance mechanosensitive channel